VGALDETASPERRALLLERLGRIAWIQQHSTRAFASYEQAVALLADRPPSAEKAFALAALGQSLMLRYRYRDAERVLRDAMEVATQVGADAVQGHALCSLGPTLVELGQVDKALAAMDRAAVLCREYGTTEDVCRTYANRVHSYYFAGRYAEAAKQADEGQRGREEAPSRVGEDRGTQIGGHSFAPSAVACQKSLQLKVRFRTSENSHHDRHGSLG